MNGFDPGNQPRDSDEALAQPPQRLAGRLATIAVPDGAGGLAWLVLGLDSDNIFAILLT